MTNYIAAIDAGTGGVRCGIYDIQGNEVSQHYCEISTLYTADGRAEQDPNMVVESAFNAVKMAIANGGIKAEEIKGLCFDGTQTTFVAVDKDGNYLSNIILWQDMRGLAMIPWIQSRLAEFNMTVDDLHRRTFRPLDMMIAGAKLLSLRQNQPDVYKKIDKVVDTQSVLLSAFGAKDHVVDTSNTGWFFSHDAITMEIDPELVEIFGFSPDIFPKLTKAGDLMGVVSSDVAAKTGLKAGTPLFQGVVDTFCSALGAGNYGTEELGILTLGSAGILAVYTDKPTPDPLCKYYTMHYPTGGYVNQFVVPIAAAAFRWTRDMLYPAGAFDHADIYKQMDMEAAASPVGAGGLAFIPNLAGSVYPVLDTNVRGGFVGCSLGTTRSDMVRASLEGISFGTRHVIECSNSKFPALRLLGGAARSDYWNQMQADIYNCAIETIAAEEASALGAAMIGAAGAGFYSSIPEAVKAMSKVKKRYEPNAENAARYNEVYDAWLKCKEDLTPRAFPALAEVRSK